MSTSTSVTAATAQAVAFLTRSLNRAYSLPTVEAARAALTSVLSGHYASSWDEHRPTAGTGRRCLSLGPGTPPRPVHLAATRACVAWARWFETLGGAEFDLFVDPGCVRVRTQGRELLVWSAAQEDLKASEAALKDSIRSTLRDKMTSGIRHRVARSISLDTENLIPAPASRSHSPASSISSGRSSLFSAVSAASVATSVFSSVESKKPLAAAPKPKSAPQVPFKTSRREKDRQKRAKVAISPPPAPTPYDGGKTTVLGGGVLLGCAMAQPRAIACV